MWKNQKNRYAVGVIGMHWLTLGLLILTYGTILLHGQALEGSEFRATLKSWHYVFGLCVLPATLVRVVLRSVSGPAPVISPPIDIWLLRASRVFHLLLVAFLIVVPVLGWLKLSADGKTLPWDLPPIASVNPDAAQQWKRLHIWVGEAGYYLIGIHAIATLGHHYILEDDVLKRMLPRRWFGNDDARD